MSAFGDLIKRYANGRRVCNCGEAYYTNCGTGIVGNERRADLPACQWGCSANRVVARNEIAERVLQELQSHNPSLLTRLPL